MPYEYWSDSVTYDVHLDNNLNTAASYTDGPLRFCTTTTTSAPYRDSVMRSNWITDASKFITIKDLEYFSHKIYKIIKEHTPIDISEEEFMKIIKDDS